ESAPAKEEGAGEGTIALGPQQAAAAAKQAAVPFGPPGGPAAPAAPASTAATPWGDAPIRPAPVAAAGEETMGVAPGGGRRQVNKKTMALAFDQQAALAQHPAAPFPLPAPETAAHPAEPIPGAPWSHVPVSSPIPLSAVGEETLG